jgi:plasmid stabilization system protein ParE
MEYRVDISRRAKRDLIEIYEFINAETSTQARDWFNRLEAVIATLKSNPSRSATTREDRTARQILYGSKPHSYRIIYDVNAKDNVVTVVHIRHGARGDFVS